LLHIHRCKVWRAKRKVQNYLKIIRLFNDIAGLKRIFIISPVRGITKEEKQFLDEYVARLESQGHSVHYPCRDTNQNDPIGLYICCENREAIRKSDEVHVYWKEKSKGSLFDFGMLFIAEKPIVLINRDEIKRTPYKSFQNVLLELDARHRKKL